MKDRFFDVLGKQLFAWSGWVFTVGGAVGSFVLGQAYAWIGWLSVLAGVLALTGHSFSTHRRCRELEVQNARLADEVREAERKLNEVPLDLVSRIQELVTPRSLTELAAQLATHADYVLRIQRFTAALAGADVHPRTFVRRDGALYAVAKVPDAALSHPRERDVFVLVRAADGLRTDCALIVVHQPPDQGLVHFRVAQLLSDDARALEQLAATREVAGLTGYTVRPWGDPGWYAALASATIPEVIVRVAEGLERDRRTGA
jgi:hypothetical protein